MKQHKVVESAWGFNTHEHASLPYSARPASDYNPSLSYQPRSIGGISWKEGSVLGSVAQVGLDIVIRASWGC